MSGITNPPAGVVGVQPPTAPPAAGQPASGQSALFLPFSRFAAWGFGLAFCLPILGVIFSHIGLASIVAGRRRGKALAVWGLVLNYLAILLYPFALALLIWLGYMVIMLMFGAPAGAYPSPIEFWAPVWTGQRADF